MRGKNWKPKSVIHHARLIDVPRDWMAIMYRAFGELIAEGKSDVLALTGDEQVIFAVNPEMRTEVIGLLVWRETEPGEWWTQLGWVRAEFRQNGVYKKMWEELLLVASINGTVKQIIGGTSYTNTEMQAVMEKLGRKPFSIMYRFDLK